MIALVVGGGPVGSLLAGSLARSGAAVSLVRRRAERRTRQVRCVEISPDGTRSDAILTEVQEPGAASGAPDLIVFAVKAFDLAGATASCAIWPRAPALTVQNGIGAEGMVAAARPFAPVLAGSLTTSASLSADGSLRLLTRGGLGLAGTSGDPGTTLDDLVSTFIRGGLPARVYPDASAMKWSKLLLNLVGNATSALLDVGPREIYADPTLYRVELAQLREALAVMREQRLRIVRLPGVDPRLLAGALRLPEALARMILARTVDGGRGGKMPSLRLHLRGGGGPSEVAWLNGAVARTAAEHGLAAPVNAVLARLVDEAAVDPKRRAWFAGRPDRLMAELLDRPMAGRHQP